MQTLPKKQRQMSQRKNIALVAHDNMKPIMLDWAVSKRDSLSNHNLYGTGTTGTLLTRALELPVESLLSGPMGGDQQLGALIATHDIDVLIFFWDPLEQQPHDPDVKALLRLAAVWNIPVACNEASADFLVSSPLLGGDYEHTVPDYDAYLNKRTASTK